MLLLPIWLHLHLLLRLYLTNLSLIFLINSLHLSTFIRYSYNWVSYIRAFNNILYLLSELINRRVSLVLNPKCDNYRALSLLSNNHELSIDVKKFRYTLDEVLISTIFLKCFQSRVKLNSHFHIFSIGFLLNRFFVLSLLNFQLSF